MQSTDAYAGRPRYRLTLALSALLADDAGSGAVPIIHFSLDDLGSRRSTPPRLLHRDCRLRCWALTTESVTLPPDRPEHFSLTRYFFHAADGQRTIDRVGTEFDLEEAARLELITRAGNWVAGAPGMLVSNAECRMELSLEDLKPIFSLMVFTTDPRSFGKGR